MRTDMGKKTVIFKISTIGKITISNHSVSIISNVRNSNTYILFLEGSVDFSNLMRISNIE